MLAKAFFLPCARDVGCQTHLPVGEEPRVFPGLGASTVPLGLLEQVPVSARSTLPLPAPSLAGSQSKKPRANCFWLRGFCCCFFPRLVASLTDEYLGWLDTEDFHFSFRLWR